VRREQSKERAQGKPVQWDQEHGRYKISPLIDWSEAQVWQYIRSHRLPYNVLHDRHFPSIGCSPCTRAIQPGESRRAGRWWWEQSESRECGLQMRIPRIPESPAALHA
jgi:phosphoadenosine phosphosulfate reductase